MAQKAPNAVDVLDIQFKLYAKTKILSFESIANNVSLLAVSNAQGLLFAAHHEKPKFEVFMLNNLIDIENICTDIFARSINLLGEPNIIACSCDGMMLAVSFSQNSSSFIQIFSVPSFLHENINVLHTIKLAPDANIAALQILWNPVISNNLAVVLTNGALGMYTLKDGGQFEMHTLDKSQQVQCGCWSPKGKQIVLGFSNGKLQQFKPDLTPAKTIVCPVGIHAGPFSTIAVHWLSTFQFAVAFVQDGDGQIPSLYIVNAPKGGTASYINYYDVCYTTGQRLNQINFTHIQQWNLLLVCSANGIEVGLLGCKETGETPTWVQYTLLDEARIEMPLTDEKDETFPIGFAYDTSCTHTLTVNDKELPAMPMIHVLSTNGQLLSFNFLNLLPGVPGVCSPPPPISFNTELFRPLEEYIKTEAVETTAIAPAVSSQQYEKPGEIISSGFMASTPLMKEKTSPFFLKPTSAKLLSGNANNVSPISNNTEKIQSAKPGISSTTVSGQSPSVGQGQKIKLDHQQSKQTKPQTQPHLQQQEQQQFNKPQQQSSTVAVSSGVKSSGLNKPLYTVPPNFTPPTTTTVNAQQMQPQKFQNNLTISSKMQSGYLELTIVQINAFDKEIKQLVALSKGLLNNLGNPDEMRGCTKRLNDLQEIVEQANDNEFEMDIQNLRYFLREARSMIGECRYKLEKYNNPDLPRLGNNTSDTINRRHLAKLQSYLATNNAQLQALKLQIDAQWSNFQDSVCRNTKSRIHIPCLDGTYQRMTKLQDILLRQRQKLNQIKTKLQQIGLLYKVSKADTSNSYVNIDTTADSLADSILSMTIAPVVEENHSKLSNEKLNAIRSFTKQRKTVNIIKPHRPDRVGLRSEVVLETMLQSERIKARESILKAASTEGSTIALSKSNIIKPVTQAMSTPTSNVFSFNTVAPNSFAKPNISAENSFKTPATMSGFVGGTQIQKSTVEPATKATEDDLITNATPQIPISFAAKVISGSNTISSKTSATTFTPTSSSPTMGFSAGDVLKPFSFTAGSTFTGFGTTPTSSPAPNTIPSTKSRNDNGQFSAAAFSFSRFTSTPANNASTKSIPAAVVSFSSSPTKVIESTATSTGIFSGFGKSVAAENSATAPLNLSSQEVAVKSSTTESQNKPSQSTVTSIACTAPLQAASITSSKTSDAVSSATTKTSAAPILTDTSFGSINICQPTTKTIDSTKPANIFSGLKDSSGFTFTPVTSSSSNFSFGDLSKSLTITPVTITAAAAIVTTSVTVATSTTTVAASTVQATATVEDIKPSDFSFTLSSLGTSLTATTKTTSTLTASTLANSAPTTAVAKTSIFGSGIATTTTTKSSPAQELFASVAHSTTTTATSTAASAVSTAPSIFYGSGSTTFFTSVVTPTTPTSSNGGTIFGATVSAPASAPSAVCLSSTFSGFGLGSTATTAANTPSSDGSIFAATGAATTTVNIGGSSPPSTNVFGGIPKPDQSVFSSTSVAQQSPSNAGGIFANTAPNASPFGGTVTSPQLNQTVGGSIFGVSSDGFSQSAGSIFGGSSAVPRAQAPAPAVNSPFGGNVPTTSAAPGSIFGNTAAQQPIAATGGGSIFGQNSFGQPAATTAQVGGLFGSGTSTQSTFGMGGSIFASTNTGATAATGGSIFGGGSSFGSPTNVTGSASGFGSFSQPNTGSPFSAAAASSGPFGQVGASVAQSGFGSPQQGSAFSKPVFGGPPTFGSPPAFGAQPTFGGAPTFGSPKPFGSFAAAAPTPPATGVFGGGAQKNNLFETLGNTDTGLSFGNLAQSASATGPKPPFGGSSFTSYRS